MKILVSRFYYHSNQALSRKNGTTSDLLNEASLTILKVPTVKLVDLHKMATSFLIQPQLMVHTSIETDKVVLTSLQNKYGHPNIHMKHLF